MDLRRFRRALGALIAAVVVVLVIHSAWAGNSVSVDSVGRMVMFALPIAGIYAVNSTGLVVVYSATGIFNLAQGSIGMIGAFLYWTALVKWHLPAVVALILVVGVFAPLMRLVLDVILMRKLAQSSVVAKLTATLGLSLTLLGLANAIWNPNSPHSIPPLGGSGGINAFGVTLTWPRVVIIGVALFLALFLRWLLFTTRLGISMRAIVDNGDLATLYGIRRGRISGLAWVIGCCSATIASILIAPELGNLSAQTLSLLIIDSFAAAAFGRLRSLPMTYLGALLLGLVVSFSTSFLQFGGRWAQLPTALPALALFAVLLFLPEANVQVGRALRTYRIERVPTWRSAFIVGGVVIAAMAIIAPLLSQGNLVRLAVAVATGVLLLGMVPLIGWAGQPFLAPYALAGFGAWLTWRLASDMPDLLAVLVGGAVTAVVGVVVALPALRLRGLYLALGSIAFAQVAVTVIFPLPGVLNADHAMDRPTLFGLSLASSTTFVIFATVVYVLLALLMVWVRRGRLGRRLIATRDSEAAAACVGISLIETKIVVFAISGLIAGIGGGLLVEAQQFVSIDQLPLIGGLSIVLSLVVFGVGTVSAPLLAGLSAAILAVITSDFLHGSLADTLTVIGPGLAALALINYPRGSIPEVVADAREHPWGLLARIVGLGAGAAVGVAFQLPGVVGIALAVIGAAGAGTGFDLATQHRSGALDPLRRLTAARGEADLDEPGLGLTRGFDENLRGQLDSALGLGGATL